MLRRVACTIQSDTTPLAEDQCSAVLPHQQTLIDKVIPIYFKSGPELERASAESRMFENQRFSDTLMTAVCASTYATGVDTAIMNTLQYIVHLQRIPETETACRGYRKPQMNFAVRRLLSI